MSFNRISALAFGIAGVLACGHAHSAAFQLKENSAKGLGRAFAGSISAPGDASVVFTNPGAMRGLDGTQLQADLSVISFGAEFDGTGRYATGSAISGGNGGDAGDVVPVPAAYFHLPVGEKQHVGMSLTAPYGFTTEYDKNWMGRYSGTKTDLKAIDLAFAYSYDVNPYVSFGANVFVERLDIELANAMDFGTIISAAGQQQAAAAVLQAGGTPAQAAAAAQQAAIALAQQGFAPGTQDGYLSIEGNDTAVGFTLGALFSVTDKTHIGVSYRSKVEHKITNGKADYTVPAAAAAVLGASRPGWFVDADGKATVTLPASATISFTSQVSDKWSVMADLSRTAWKSAFDEVVIDYASAQADSVLGFHYDDTTFASIGAEYRYSDALTFRGGVAYDETPTSYAHRDVRVPDVTRKWLSLGLTWNSSEKVEWNLGYTHLFTNDANVNTTSATANTLFGVYDVKGDILAASVNYKF
ncbi:MAG: outer membrane protein transport protein [Pseudoxanthomonas sp.]